METVSVSKGVFTLGSYTFGRKRRKCENEYLSEPWYLTYKQTLEKVQNSTKKINETMYKQILQDLLLYVKSVDDESMKILPSEIPTAILLAGINVPDHIMLFEKVESTLSKITPYIATISSKKCNSMKSMVEESIYQIMNAHSKDEPIVKKTNCTFGALNSWYHEHNTHYLPLVIVIRDFENFTAKALHNFVFNLSKRSAMKIVLIFGIATSLHVVHRTLSYDVTSKLRVKVFSTQTQVQSLSDTLEGIVFSHEVPFKLTGKAFKFLQELFLFYDLSVDGYLQAYKVCMAIKFFNNNCASLCCGIDQVKKNVASLKARDIQEFRKLPSIAYHFQGKENLSDKEFKIFLEDCAVNFQKYMHKFLSVLKCLHALISSCAYTPFGRHFRDIYEKAVNSNLTESDDYTKTIQYLLHLPKDEFVSKIRAAIEVAENNEKFLPKDFKKHLKGHLIILQDASEVLLSPSKAVQKSPKTEAKFNKRAAFYENLRNNAYQQTFSPYKRARENFINYLDKEIFSVHLKNPQNILGFEIFCFDDRGLVNRPIKGSLRASIETPLTNPRSFIGCSCCKTNNDEQILNTMPDLSIVYKLHMENRKLINMYDWLQAFLAIIDPGRDEDQREIDPVIHSRFSQAVADLQLLGYIKPTKMKTDHVKKLT